MDNYNNLKLSSCKELNAKADTRRVFHHLEQRYLLPEARFMAYSLLSSKSIPQNITENVIHQALMLGFVNGEPVDEMTFRALFEAVTLNPSFQVVSPMFSMMNYSSSWVS